MIELFFDGGAEWMGLLTVELLALFLAAWKAPAWVKEIGLIALTTGAFSCLIGLFLMSDILAKTEMPSTIIYGGLKVALIAPLYGMLIYVVSLILRIIHKPRLL
jgi:hypothetical protein